MKQTLILAFIILSATSCNDNSEPDRPEADAGLTGKLPPIMLKQELPTTFIPDSMWEWHNWVKL